jgi:hypothetical protein
LNAAELSLLIIPIGCYLIHIGGVMQQVSLRHSREMRSIEPAISRFSDAQLRI